MNKVSIIGFGRFGVMLHSLLSKGFEVDVYDKNSINNSEINEVSLEEALKLFDYPKSLGDHENLEVTVKVGRFGPYIQFGTENVSIPKGTEPDEVLLENAIALINEKRAANAPIAEYENLPVSKGKGRFGPFIKWNDLFINVNKNCLLYTSPSPRDS